MKLKKIIVVILSTSLVLGLAACGTKTPKTVSNTDNSSAVNTSGDVITLRMAWWGSQTRHDATMEVIKLYEKQNTNIKIEAEFYDYEGYFNKLNTLVASNTVWDIFQMGGNFPLYQEKIVPLDDYVTQGIVDVSDTTETFLKTTEADGKLIGISSGVNAQGIAYDPALFLEAGVPEPTENWTWDDWKNACLTIHNKLGIYGSSKMEEFVAGCSVGIPQVDYSLNFFAVTNDKLGFDDPSLLVDYFAIKKELVDAGAYPDPGAIQEIKDIEGDYLVTGEAAMTWVTSNQFPTVAAASGRDLKMAVPPRKTADGPSGIVVQSSQMLCVSADSKAPEEAAKFISFFQNDLEANEILNGERGVPVMSKVRDALTEKADEAKQIMFDYVDLVGSFKTGEVNVISPESKIEIEDQYKLLMDQVVYGEKTPEEAAQAIFDFATAKFQ